ncbi:MAG: N-acetylmuramoyl-L-alanine amidase [Rhodobacteraceae bacterium]|nr:N-acetylmuramoyl-L-alanine amidase [Paracoccaceae bacterium]
MNRLFGFLSMMWLTIAALPGLPAWAQGFSGLARIDPTTSRISDLGKNGVGIDLMLSQGVPYRLFTLDNPPRLVLDFQEVDWSGLETATFLATTRVGQVQFGGYVPGWSRMVIGLNGPMFVQTSEMSVDLVLGSARVALVLMPSNSEAFAASSGAPYDARWDLPAPTELGPRHARPADAPVLVVLDPGHGGIDPGAKQGEIVEKDLMLRFARELREILLRKGGFEVVLTRDGDHFVSLEARISAAHRAGAGAGGDVFISLHADSLAEGLAHGATVHVLSREASDIASAKLAERHDRADILSGVDLSNTDDSVTAVLLDLARQETQPRTDALARALVDAMAQTGGPMNRRPLRAAAFSVLKAADIPSVLIELGFLSSPRDFKNLSDDDWRAGMALGIANGLAAWRAQDLATRPLIRQ